MAEVVTIITCTGHRPEAFKLCQSYIHRQTYKGSIQWIVIDDGPSVPESEIKKKEFEYYKAPRPWQPDLNTQRFNLEEAFKYIKGDYIFVMEDDDYYTPGYIDYYVSQLKKAEMVGEGNSKYYNLKIPGYKEMHNYLHSSLSQTAFRKSVLPLFKKAIDSGEMFIDIVLWREARNAKLGITLNANSGFSCCIKGMPGRSNLGIGDKQKDYMYDPGFAKLKEWVGADAETYKQIRDKKQNV